MKPLFLIPFFIVFHIQINAQTCIILFRDQNQIVVGADSRRIFAATIERNGIKKDTLIYDTICKTRRINKNVYVSVTGWNIEKTFDVALSSSFHAKTLEGVADCFIQTEKHVFANFLKQAKVEKSNFYKKYYYILDTTTILFYGCENNVLKVIKITMGKEQRRDDSVKINVETEKILSDSIYPKTLYNAYPIGHTDAVIPLINQYHLGSSKWIEWVKFLLEQQQIKTPNEVHEPFDILLITKTEAIWKYKSGKCSQ